MKTAHIARRFTFSEWGGTESVVWNTVQTLTQLGHPAEIFATNALDSHSEEERDGIKIHRLSYWYPYFPLSSEKIRTLDKKGGNPWVPDLEKRLIEPQKFDLLHCHTMGRMAAVIRKAAKRAGIPYVISFHGGCFDIPEEEIQEMLKPLRHTLRYGAVLDRLLGIRSNALDDADGLLCVGGNELEPVRAKYPDKLVAYLPNGVDCAHFRTPATVDFRTEFKIPKNRKILLSVSRIDYQKNQLMLLDVLDRLGPDWQLVLIGAPTAEWYYQKIQKAIVEKDLADRVTIIPGLPPDSPHLPAAYQSAECFALPSLHEPFGIVILEAWSAGVPVIAAPVGGINHLIRDGENGFFAPAENAPARWAEIAKGITPEIRNAITSSARRYVEENYSWQTITGRLLDFYEEVRHRSASK